MKASANTRATFAATPADPRHGTRNGYDNLCCRCDRCREAWRIYCLDWNHRSGRRLPREVRAAIADDRLPHGTEYGYRRGCRCSACRQASTEARRERRANSAVPCVHGCGRYVDSTGRRNPDKPYECRSCAVTRIHAERRAATA